MAGTNWDARFMGLAHYIAGWSKERGRRVGAVIIGPDNEIRATGHNGFARGVNEDVASRHERLSGEKYFWSSHAERNAIYNAARVGIAINGCRMYVPWFPCGECAKAIIQSGISELVAYEPDLADERWGADFRRVQQMLDEAGVRVRFIGRLMDLEDGSLLEE
jgi:dCMP deaminase